MRAKPLAVTGGVLTAVLAWQAAASLLFLAALGFWSAYPWPDRLWMWTRYAIEAPPNAVVHRWLAISGVLPLLPLLLVVPLVARRQGGSAKPVYGQTDWADRKEMTNSDIVPSKRPF